VPADFDVERVLYDDDDDAGAEPGELLVTFSDEVAHERSHLVDRAASAIAAFPGVAEAHREDREEIIVTGAQLDPADVEARLVTWWDDQLAGGS
jgi:hypothetical protein